MLTVVLSVLRVIGLILLIVLGIVLGLLLLVLFMPIVYKVHADKQEGTGLNTDGLTAYAKVRWFFGLIRASYCYPDPGNAVVKVLFFTVYDSGKETDEKTDREAEQETGKKSGRKFGKKSEKAKKLRTEDKQGETSEESQAEIQADFVKTEVVEGPRTDTAQGMAEDWIDQEKVSEHEAAWEEIRAKLRGEEPESKFDKIIYTFRNTCDKISDIRENISYYRNVLEDEQTKRLFHHLLLRVGRTLKNIRPRKLQADIRFGTGAPDTTGYLFGLYGMFAYSLGKHFILTPDFERAALEGSFYARGHIMPVQVLWHGLMLVLDKKLWDFIARVKR